MRTNLGPGVQGVRPRRGKLTIRAQDLALGDLRHEVRLLLGGVGGEALVHGGGDGLLDLLALVLRLGLGLLLLGAHLVALVAAQAAAEVGVRAALVVEVGRVSCWRWVGRVSVDVEGISGGEVRD